MNAETSSTRSTGNADTNRPGNCTGNAHAITVILVDDDPLIVQSLRTILEARDAVQVVGTSTEGCAAAGLYAASRPDIALLDIRMPHTSGLAAAERILASDPDARVVFLTTFADDDYIVRALALGARGYLIKQDVATLEGALRAVMDGQIVMGAEVSGRVGALAGRSLEGGSALAGSLTEREREVAELIAEGLDNREIAAALYLSEGTVRNHISAILQKCGLRNRTQIAIAWWR
ncbi:response regulator transcription factor [Adlercreutzia sp. R7]|uniref:Response regulator transcription factor n=1 Tax=Adlercreutzia wanghongyangiae TaxID=3111451 RepID=A0ABU6IH95_9ACTN|nr:response regulator transcription factor [Adlercreutzia sp. R7]